VIYGGRSHGFQIALTLVSMNKSVGQVVSLAEVTQLRVPAADRRREVRLKLREVYWLRGARLKYGPEAEIVDISSNGIRIRSARELSVNDTVVIELQTRTGIILAIARVIRSRQIAASPSAWFETAFQFKHPLETERNTSPTNI
jgi:hypothetical protein